VSTPTSILEAQALAAFAEPIEQHARSWAEGVVASIERDVRDGITKSFHAELDQVVPAEEWGSAAASVFAETAAAGCRIPEPAREWASRVWRHALKAAFAAYLQARREAAKARGLEVLREAAGRVGEDFDRG
jgi:hypothetical protein